MRTGLDHLPASKQRELERVVQILFEEFDEARVLATQDWKKKGRILKIVLYGSYARGGWVDEPHTAKGYQSDFDLLIIVNDERLTDRVEYWAKAEERLNRELSITKTLKTPVNFIVHSLHEVNDGLAHGRFFFIPFGVGSEKSWSRSGYCAGQRVKIGCLSVTCFFLDLFAATKAPDLAEKYREHSGFGLQGYRRDRQSRSVGL